MTDDEWTRGYLLGYCHAARDAMMDLAEDRKLYRQTRRMLRAYRDKPGSFLLELMRTLGTPIASPTEEEIHRVEDIHKRYFPERTPR